MGRAKTYEIDSEKLTMAIKKRGLTKESCSELMGFDRQFLWKVIYHKKITLPAVRLLDCMFDIPLSEYSKVEVKNMEIRSRKAIYEELHDDIVEIVTETVGGMVEEIVREALVEAMTRTLKGVVDGQERR